jgi:hypothetical protein
LDADVARLAERQHGVVAHRQLVALGMSPEAIKRRVGRGSLHPLHRGVLAVGHRVLSQRSRWMAAVLACGPDAVLSHWSAAALWGIRGTRGGPIDITSPRKTKSRGAIRRHRVLLPPDEVTVEAGIPVTSAPRTVFDLAAVSSPQTVESVLRQCEYRRLYDSLSLGDLVGRYPRHRGNRAARTALARLEESPGETEEGLEERFLAFVDRYELPRPDFNAWLEVQGHRYKVDCLWAAQRLIAELDSWQAHGTRSSFQSDKARDRRLLRAGYRTTRITWAQLGDEPEAIARDLHALL